MAMMTHNEVIVDNSNLTDVLRVVQGNVHPEEDSSRAVNTVSVRDITVYIQAETNHKPVHLDSNRQFATSVDLE